MSPIPNISIKIKRKKNDNQDWTGVFNSDILNPFYFKGLYFIENPGLGDRNGWHEVYFFKKPKIIIAFNLHHLDDNNKWVVDQGYTIEKVK